MKLILSIALVGIIFLAGCTIQQIDNVTQNESYEQNETQNKTVELPKEIAIEENITKNICEQKIIFDDVVISFNGDCIVMNISDSVTKQPISNATVRLAIYTPCVGFICPPQIISEKQTKETGHVFFYKHEIDNHELIKRNWKINTIIFDAKGYNTTEKAFDYEYNQLINFELEPIKTYCKQDSDCVSVAIKCCSCNKLEELKAVNKRFADDFKPNCGEVLTCTAGCPIVNKIKVLCENNRCILSPMDMCKDPSDCTPSNYGCVSKIFCSKMADCQEKDERYKCISCTDNICFP